MYFFVKLFSFAFGFFDLNVHFFMQRRRLLGNKNNGIFYITQV